MLPDSVRANFASLQSSWPGNDGQAAAHEPRYPYRNPSVESNATFYRGYAPAPVAQSHGSPALPRPQ